MIFILKSDFLEHFFCHLEAVGAAAALDTRAANGVSGWKKLQQNRDAVLGPPAAHHTRQRPSLNMHL